MIINWNLIAYRFNEHTFDSTGVNRSMSQGKPIHQRTPRKSQQPIQIIIYPGDQYESDILETIDSCFNKADESSQSLLLIFHESYIVNINILLMRSFGYTLDTSQEITNDVYKDAICKCADRAIDKDKIEMIQYDLRRSQMVHAREIMIPHPRTIFPTTTVNRAYDLMQRMNIGHFPVVTFDGQFWGIVSDTDLLSYTIPEDYPEELVELKLQLADLTKIEDVMVYFPSVKPDAAKLITGVIYADEEHITFLRKFFRKNHPALNLLMVLDDEEHQQLVGVISWIDVLDNWDRIGSDKFNKKPAYEIATPIMQMPIITETTSAVAGIVEIERGRDTVHRHIIRSTNGQFDAVFHFHELLPYTPIENNPQLKLFWYNKRIHGEIPQPKHSIKTRTIPFDLPIWSKDGDSVVGKFLKHIKGTDEDGKPLLWRDRLAGLLLQQKDGTLSHFLNPYDIIQAYLNTL